MISAKLERHVSNSLSLAKKNRPCINFLVTNKIQKCLEGMHARAQFAIKISRYFLVVHKFKKKWTHANRSKNSMTISLTIIQYLNGSYKIVNQRRVLSSGHELWNLFCYFLYYNGFFMPSKWYLGPKIVFKKVGDATRQACLCNYALRIYEFVMNSPSMKFSLQFQEIGFPCAHLEVVKLFQGSARS